MTTDTLTRNEAGLSSTRRWRRIGRRARGRGGAGARPGRGQGGGVAAAAAAVRGAPATDPRRQRRGCRRGQARRDRRRAGRPPRARPEAARGGRAGLEDIAALPDPVGRVLAQWTRPNGLDISRVSVPLGVIGIIYESRPNVTADAGGLCLKSGNAAILRGGSESFHSSRALVAALRGCARPGCRKTRSSWCRPATARPSA